MVCLTLWGPQHEFVPFTSIMRYLRCIEPHLSQLTSWERCAFLMQLAFPVNITSVTMDKLSTLTFLGSDSGK